MREARRDSLAETTRTAVQAYEEIKPNIPVLKAWEQVAPKRGQTIAYQLFDGTLLARRRDGRITTQNPRRMPIMIPVSWTRGRVDDHIEQAVKTDGMTHLSATDIDAFLRTGRLPGPRRGRSYTSLESELTGYTDAARENRAEHAWGGGWARHIPQVQTRENAMHEVDWQFRRNQDDLLKGRIRYHMLGSRRGYLGIHRQAVHVMWRRMLDRDVALATMRAFGRKASVHDYNRVMAAWHLPCGRDGSGDRGLRALGETHRSAFVFHRVMGAAETGGAIADEIVGMPARLRTITGSARVWRATRTWTDPQIIPVARLVARTQEDPASRTHLALDTALGALARIVERRWPSTLLTSICWMQDEDLRLVTPFLPAMNAAATEARRQRRLRAFTASINLVMDMLKGMDEDDHAALVRDARNATWRRLDERQAQWHRERAHLRLEEDEADIVDEWGENAAWTPLLGTHAKDGCEATEIVDALGLLTEAREMVHCSDSYVPECLSGMSRIFSLRSGDDRSTLELRRRNGTWHVQQNYTVGNTTPVRSLQAFGRRVARAANRANPVVTGQAS